MFILDRLIIIPNSFIKNALDYISIRNGTTKRKDKLKGL